MLDLRVTLFGKFNIRWGDQQLIGMEALKVQELFSYMLLFRNHPQPRESLCELLWAKEPPAKSKKHLRQTLWRLRKALEERGDRFEPELLTEGEWIQINPSFDIWTDAAEFEQTFKLVNGKRVRKLTPDDFKLLQHGIDLYKGDLLEGWYHDWCLIERERFRIMHLLTLDKLVQYCELRQDYETGLIYALEILRHDRAYERAHRHLMRLHYLAGNRTQALQQYERCAAALRNELDVEPSIQTKRLYDQIRSDNIQHPAPAIEEVSDAPAKGMAGMLERLMHLAEEIDQIQSEVRTEIGRLESTLSAQH